MLKITKDSSTTILNYTEREDSIIYPAIAKHISMMGNSVTTFLGTHSASKDSRGAIFVEFEPSTSFLENVQNSLPWLDKFSHMTPDGEDGREFNSTYVPESFTSTFDDKFLQTVEQLDVSDVDCWEIKSEFAIAEYIVTQCDMYFGDPDKQEPGVIYTRVSESDVNDTWTFDLGVSSDSFELGTYTVAKTDGVPSVTFTPSKIFKQAVKDDAEASTPWEDDSE